MDLAQYAQAFKASEEDFERQVESFGIPFESRESCPRSLRVATAKACGCNCENAGGSLWMNWISPACLACRTGERTATFFIDLVCQRSCYFCFNPNQDHYEYFLSHRRDISAELEQAKESGAQLDFLAVTGGEPLLHQEEVERFFRTAKRLYPHAYTRLYTNGDLLDENGLQTLTDSGLDEIRFSIKPDEDAAVLDKTFRTIEWSATTVPVTMVEMPVIPGTLQEMKQTLSRLDSIGIAGINLLEFCFPLCNAKEFSKRGFRLRKHPYTYLYDYWYGGGIPVAGSETESLELLRYANREGFRMGVHYCSSDNKNTGQIYQQNKAFAETNMHEAFPWLKLDPEDHFLKCAKAFGSDMAKVLKWAKERRLDTFSAKEDVPSISFPLSWADRLQKSESDVEIGRSVNVLEEKPDGGLKIREVSIDPLR